MYIQEQALNSLKKFHDYVLRYQEQLNIKLGEIEEQLSIKDVIKKIKTEKDYNFILDNKDVLIKLDSSLENKLKIIEFFVKNNATNAEQFLDVLDSVINSDIINNFENTILELTVFQEKIKLNLEQCSLILDKGTYDYEYYIKLLEQSNLTEKEKIDVLSEEAFKSVMINNEKQEEVSEEIKEENIKIEQTNDVKVSSLEVEQRYRNIIESVNDVIAKYYYLIEQQNSNELKYKKQYINAMHSESLQIDFSVLSSAEERLSIIILEMIENKGLIEKELKNIDNHVISKEDAEVINLFLDTLENNLKESKETARKLDIDNKEKNNSTASKVLFLLDDNGQPYMNFKEVNLEVKKRILSAIEKLEKGIYDYERGIKHTKMITDNENDNIYVNRSSNIACSYIRLTNDFVLIIAMSDFKSIYDFSKYIHQKNRKLVDKHNNLSEEELIKLIGLQSEIRSELENDVSLKGDAKK